MKYHEILHKIRMIILTRVDDDLQGDKNLVVVRVMTLLFKLMCLSPSQVDRFISSMASQNPIPTSGNQQAVAECVAGCRWCPTKR